MPTVWRETLNGLRSISGRFSVLTAGGFALAQHQGANIKALMEGASTGSQRLHLKSRLSKMKLTNMQLFVTSFTTKAMRLRKSCGLSIIILLRMVKQLAGESEGKTKKVFTQLQTNFSTDLHSLGQFIRKNSYHV